MEWVGENVEKLITHFVAVLRCNNFIASKKTIIWLLHMLLMLWMCRWYEIFILPNFFFPANCDIIIAQLICSLFIAATDDKLFNNDLMFFFGVEN
jgi:hypothetical protein